MNTSLPEEISSNKSFDFLDFYNLVTIMLNNIYSYNHHNSHNSERDTVAFFLFEWEDFVEDQISSISYENSDTKQAFCQK